MVCHYSFAMTWRWPLPGLRLGLGEATAGRGSDSQPHSGVFRPVRDAQPCWLRCRPREERVTRPHHASGFESTAGAFPAAPRAASGPADRPEEPCERGLVPGTPAHKPTTAFSFLVFKSAAPDRTAPSVLSVAPRQQGEGPSAGQSVRAVAAILRQDYTATGLQPVACSDGRAGRYTHRHHLHDEC